MIEYLDTSDIQDIGTAVLGYPIVVRDYGLLLSAAGRPQGSVFGQDAYPDLFSKAAALLHSLARNHAFQDGNKRTAWASAAVFLDLNGHPPVEPFDEDKAERLVLDTARGLMDVPLITAELSEFFG